MQEYWLQKNLLDTKWDVVHSHSPLYAKIAIEAIGDGPRYIHTAHSPVVMEQEAKWIMQGLSGKIKLLLGRKQLANLEKSALESVHEIHTLSCYTRDVLESLYGIGSKCTVIPHWCREYFGRGLFPLVAYSDITAGMAAFQNESVCIFQYLCARTLMGKQLAAYSLLAHNDVCYGFRICHLSDIAIHHRRPGA
jgi:hypothetical protein